MPMVVKVKAIESIRILRFSALKILKTLSNRKALRALRLPLPDPTKISTRLMMTIKVSKMLNFSLRNIRGPRPTILRNNSKVKIDVNK